MSYLMSYLVSYRVARSTHAAALAAFATLAAWPHAARSGGQPLAEVVVTAPQMRAPLVVEVDPKAPQQPVPASDGAGFLKNVPGFSLIRKGGTDGDPVLRGLAGSRLNILLDGAEFHGGCGMRMDPPTAYVFPETYDRVRIVKGPQTVLHGNGNLAGVVLFEREAPRLGAPAAKAHASLMAGSWDRVDAVADVSFGTSAGFGRATATHSESGNYRDGSGRTVHSFYERRSLGLQGGWTPDRDTRVEISAVRSEAEAAYADRSMDGSVFDRDGVALHFERKRVSPLVRKLDARLSWNYIDHVMDNYSLRAKPAGKSYSWNNPDRETLGVRVSADLALGERDALTVGADRRGDTHTLRAANGPSPVPIESKTRMRDFESSIAGVFGEWMHTVSKSDRVVSGLRLDRFEADRFNAATGASNGSTDGSLKSGFARFERDLAALPATVYVGLGHSERPLDHWESTTWNGLTASRALRPERGTQLDAGLVWNGAAVTGSLSAFYGRIGDYVLTQVDPIASGSCGSNPSKCTTQSVRASRHGLEGDLAWRFAPRWTLRGSVALVRASNDTMHVPLAQTPADESKLGLGYDDGTWAWGGTARFVGRQDRVHPNFGTVVGQDIGPTPGFATLSLNAGYRLGKRVRLTAGVDNVFDRTYAEHVSRAAVAVAGYDAPSTRVNEPGRTVWAKLTMTLD